MTLEGIDISHHQATTPDLSRVDFVIVRATYGATPDRKYPEHAAAVRAAGKVLGAYHFALPVSIEPVADQYAAFRDRAWTADLWAIDREADIVTGPDGERINRGTISKAATRAFIRLAHDDGRRVLLYTRAGLLEDFGQDGSWVPDWTGEPAKPWDIWQHTNRLGGVSLDGDRFRGTLGGLLALGAPYDPWVDAKVAELAAMTTRAETAEAEVARLNAQMDALLAESSELKVVVAAMDHEIRVTAAALSTLDAFRVRHEVAEG